MTPKLKPGNLLVMHQETASDAVGGPVAGPFMLIGSRLPVVLSPNAPIGMAYAYTPPKYALACAVMDKLGVTP